MESPTTKENVLNTAIKMMLENGYQATSVGNISKEVGITKAGFFHHFASKETLASEALTHFYQPMKRLLETELSDQSDSDPLQQIVNYVDKVATGITNPDVPTSCLIGNLMQEMSLSHPQLQEQCHHILNDWSGAIEATFHRAMHQHNTPDSVNAHELAEMFIAIYEGALIIAKTRQRDAVISELFEHYKRYILDTIK